MTNHPAFPIAPYEGDNTNPPLRANSGISALHYIATAIAAALIAKTKGEIEPEELAQTSFAYSKAMLEEGAYYLNKK
jgi:hypothetical protein